MTFLIVEGMELVFDRTGETAVSHREIKLSENTDGEFGQVTGWLVKCPYLDSNGGVVQYLAANTDIAVATEIYGKGDFVTRTGEDIHFVLEYEGDSNGLFVCVVPDGSTTCHNIKKKRNTMSWTPITQTYLKRFSAKSTKMMLLKS